MLPATSTYTPRIAASFALILPRVLSSDGRSSAQPAAHAGADALAATLVARGGEAEHLLELVVDDELHP